MIRENLRNVAIIAHVDHGKTTLVDALLKQSHVFRENEKVAERVMDSNDLERERGITILSKNTAVMHDDIKINIVDTPGHADFGGEVERVLNMVDGVLLLVDAYEGPMPQTKYVLRKALEQGLKPIVVINKIDCPDQRVKDVEDEVIELFMELEADDDQLDFPVVYASARSGVAKTNWDDEAVNMDPLFETLINEIPAPEGDIEGPLQFMVTTLDHDNFVGKIAVGRIVRGTMKPNQQVAVMNGEITRKARIGRVYTYNGLNRVETDEAKMGDIIAFVGIDDINIGDTIADAENPEALPSITIDEPTLSMVFSVNNSPFAGRDGEFVTSRHLRDRLFREVETNVSMKVEETDSADAFKVSGRGELHLAVLIETMRREGFEMGVSRPQVIMKEIDGEKQEPYENVTFDVEEQHQGSVMEQMGFRKGEMTNMEVDGKGRIRIEATVPSRGLIGFRSEFLTMTSGTGIMTSSFSHYGPAKAGTVAKRQNGVLISMVQGTCLGYALFTLQDRGRLFAKPQLEVYEGMIIGINSRSDDMVVNPTKAKQLTNVRASGTDEALTLTPALEYTLEQALEFIEDDELVEVTPKSIRIRKRYLTENERKRNRDK